MRPDLPVGFHTFSSNAFVNYQLNRWYSLGYTRKEDLEEAGHRIRSFDDNKRVFLNLPTERKAPGVPRTPPSTFAVTGRIFTRAEHAENHCQMGNLTIALECMTDWLAALQNQEDTGGVPRRIEEPSR